MKMNKKGTFVPRAIDRMMFGVLSALLTFSGLYVVGPWYLQVNGAEASPLLNLLNNPTHVKVYGALLIVCGLSMLWCSFADHTRRRYAAVLSYTLFAAFMFRLYSFIAIVFTLDSLLPPNYISHGATVLITGALWVYVRFESNHEGTS